MHNISPITAAYETYLLQDSYRNDYLKIWKEELADLQEVERSNAKFLRGMDKPPHHTQIAQIANLRAAERACRLQNIESLTMVDGWQVLYDAYKKDPFMLKTALRINLDVKNWAVWVGSDSESDFDIEESDTEEMDFDGI